jgi:hypothetical protein
MIIRGGTTLTTSEASVRSDSLTLGAVRSDLWSVRRREAGNGVQNSKRYWSEVQGEFLSTLGGAPQRATAKSLACAYAYERCHEQGNAHGDDGRRGDPDDGVAGTAIGEGAHEVAIAGQTNGKHEDERQ